MSRDSLVAINIVQNNNDKKILLNPNKVPILFYWNGETRDIKDSFLNNESLKQYIVENLLNLDQYGKISINYFYFTYDGDNENYQEDSIMLQDIYKLDLQDTEKIINFLYIIFCILYYQFLKRDYAENANFSKQENIQNMYVSIQNAYPKRFVKESVINYVRNELTTKYKINNENTEIILNVLSQILLYNE